MDLSQYKRARKTAAELMRLSSEHTGTVEELLLVEAAKFLLGQTDLIQQLQNELDQMIIEQSRSKHQKSGGNYTPFRWATSPLAKLIEQHTPNKQI